MEMRRQERQAKRAHTKRCHKSSPRSKAGKAAQNDEPGYVPRSYPLPVSIPFAFDVDAQVFIAAIHSFPVEYTF